MAYIYGTNDWYWWLNPNDFLRGTNNGDRIWGYGGDDEIYGRRGNDRIYAGPGDDLLDGSYGRDSLYGQQGDDTLVGSEDGDHIDGGAGFDIASFEYSSVGVDVRLTQTVSTYVKGHAHGGHAAGDTIVNVEGLRGSDHDDVLYGNNENNVIEGLDGDDYIVPGGSMVDGTGRTDVVYGGAGFDTVEAGNSDLGDFFGGAGIDTISLVNRTNGYGVSLGSSSFHSVENIIGSRYGEAIYGDGMNNRLEGRGGDDILSGGGNNDTLIGGAGDDRMWGGGNADHFHFHASNSDTQYDTIVDFAAGQDKIVIEYLPGVRFAGVVDTFSEIMRDAEWVGDSPVTAWRGDGGTELHLGDDTILLQGVEPDDLSASDFVFI